MKMSDILKSKLLKIFIKGSLTVIGISFVLFFCVVALLLLHSGNNLDWKVFILILVIAIPLIVFLLVLLNIIGLLKSQYNSSGNTNKEPLIKILKMETTINTCIKIINAVIPDSGKEAEKLHKSFKEILELLAKISSEDEVNGLENKILYDNVDTKMLSAKPRSDSGNMMVVSN